MITAQSTSSVLVSIVESPVGAWWSLPRGRSHKRQTCGSAASADRGGEVVARRWRLKNLLGYSQQSMTIAHSRSHFYERRSRRPPWKTIQSCWNHIQPNRGNGADFLEFVQRACLLSGRSVSVSLGGHNRIRYIIPHRCARRRQKIRDYVVYRGSMNMAEASFGRSRRREGRAENKCTGKHNFCLGQHFSDSCLSIFGTDL
jgi:hypothetical protein